MGDFVRSGTRMSRWGHWVRTPVALLAMLAAGAVVLVVLVPGARQQVALSVTRLPDRYLEVYFPPGQSGPRCGSTTRIPVRFWLVSHLPRTERVRYVVRGASSRTAGRPVTGRVELAPGERIQVVRSVLPPHARRFRVLVRLPGRAEGLSLRCGEPQGRHR